MPSAFYLIENGSVAIQFIILIVDGVKAFAVRDKFQLTQSRGHSFVTKCTLYWH